MTGCSKKERCSCTEVNYGYDSQGIRIKEGEVEISCPSSLNENEIQFDYDGFGRPISEIKKICN